MSLEKSSFEKTIVVKPWGHEYLIYQNSNLAIWYLCIKPQKSTSLHLHEKKLTLLILLNGHGEILKGKKNHNMLGFGSLEIAPGVPHMTKNTGCEDIYLIEIETPNDKLDLVRLKDEYGRKGMGYESTAQLTNRLVNQDYIEFSDESYRNEMQTEIYKKKVKDNAIYFVSTLNKNIFKNELIQEISDSSLIYPLNKKSFGLESVIKFQTELKKYLLKNDNTKAFEFLIVNKSEKKCLGSELITEAMSNIFPNPFFSSIGDANIHLLINLMRLDGNEVCLFYDDYTAALACEGFSSASNNCGLVIIGSESGAIEALPVIVNCFKDSTASVFFRIEDKEIGNDSKKIELEKLALDYIKKVIRINDSDLQSKNFYSKINLGYKLALDGRPGPVLITVEPSLLLKYFNKQVIKKIETNKKRTQMIEKEVKGFDFLLKELKNSKRPLVVIGKGVLKSLSESEISKFISLLGERNIPYVTTRSAIEIGHYVSPNHYGRIGTYGNRHSNFIVENSDLVILLGARAGLALTGKNVESFAPKAKKILLDIDSKNIDREFVNFKKFEVDLKVFIAKLLKQSNQIPKVRSNWISYCKYLRENFNESKEKRKYNKTRDVQRVIAQITEFTKPEVTFCVDGGSLLHQFTQNAKINSGQRVINSSSMESVGQSFAIAVGVNKFDEEINRKTIAVTDSFGIINNLRFIQSIKLNKSNLLFVYLSDKELKSLTWNQNYLYPASTIGFGNMETRLNIASIWSSFGFKYKKIRQFNIIEWDKIINSNFSNLLIEIEVEGLADLTPRVGYKKMKNGIWIQNSLGMMTPIVNIPTFENYETLKY